jgi:hypothetical protein
VKRLTRAGTVIDVKPNKKSRNPAYVMSIDFGEELGVKKSSAQITALNERLPKQSERFLKQGERLHCRKIECSGNAQAFFEHLCSSF